MSEILAAHGISVSRGKQSVLHEVSLSIGSGELVAIIGPNGAGKSTLLHALAGTLPVSCGDVCFGGRGLRAYAATALARGRALLTQDVDMSFDFDVLDVVLLGLTPHGALLPRRTQMLIALRALDSLGVIDLAGRRYAGLSGGERQRVQLARVMAQLMPDTPGITGKALLLDEPTSSQDLMHQHTTLRLAREFVGKGNAAVVVLHDLNLALQYATRLVCIRDGRLSHIADNDDRLSGEALSAALGIPIRLVCVNELGRIATTAFGS